MKSYKTVAPPFLKVVKNPWMMISTFFGSGCITPAPGTWGTFAAWLAFAILSQMVNREIIGIISIIVFVLGVIAIPKCEPILHKMDHGSIVIDEVVATWMALLLTPLGIFWQLGTVLSFRFFDIVKLPPASSIDSRRQNGFTVMLDDIFAAIYAVLVVNLIAWVLLNFDLAQPVWKLI